MPIQSRCEILHRRMQRAKIQELDRLRKPKLYELELVSCSMNIDGVQVSLLHDTHVSQEESG